MSLKFAGQVLLAYQEAAVKSGIKTYYYDIAGHTLRLDFAGSSLIPFLTPAFEHLATASGQDRELAVHIWDSSSTGVDIPPFPWKDNPDAEHFPSSGERSLINPVIHFKDDVILGLYYYKSGVLNIFDPKNRHAVFWVSDSSKLSYSEMSSPLLIILQWWLRSFGLQVVHAGAVGISGEGVLLAGRGGSGKSCTVMACLESGMHSAGDDFVLIDSSSPPKAFSLYNSSKLYPSDRHRFPSLAKRTPPEIPADEDKSLVFLPTIFPQKMAGEMRVRAILFPYVDSKADTALIPLSPAYALKNMAPSSLYVLRSAGQEDLNRMAQLVVQIPGYSLRLGKDSFRAPELILSLLKDRCKEEVLSEREDF